MEQNKSLAKPETDEIRELGHNHPGDALSQPLR